MFPFNIYLIDSVLALVATSILNRASPKNYEPCDLIVVDMARIDGNREDHYSLSLSLRGVPYIYVYIYIYISKDERFPLHFEAVDVNTNCFPFSDSLSVSSCTYFRLVFFYPICLQGLSSDSALVLDLFPPYILLPFFHFSLYFGCLK
jgi:hypothetical protein